jgi:hypothetical protein
MTQTESLFSKMNNLEIVSLRKENITDFAQERNILLGKSKAEWILFLDSDETASPALMTEVRDLMTRRNLVNGFYIKRKIIFLGKEIGEDKVLRLAKKEAGKWTRAVHETWQVRGKVGTLDGYIIHNTATNLHDYIKKMNNYSTLHAVENKKEGKHSNLFKIIVYPKLKFIQNLIAGRGLVFSLMQSFHSFLGWVKLWELQKN